MAKNSGANRKNQSKNSGPKSGGGNKSHGGSNEKSFFRVDGGRAQKAKKNKAFVKFNKTIVTMINQESISRLNNNLDSLQTAVRGAQKQEPQFVNPAKEASKEFERITDDLDAAIDKLSSAL